MPITDRELCTGCTACYSSCPVSCIAMKQDTEGFWHPEIGEKCISCGKCQQICPQNNPVSRRNEFAQIAFAACSKDRRIWERSSSGGAFSEICKAWGDALFVGAAWDGLSVCYIGVEGVERITPLCKSKYVESALGDTFKLVKAQLDSNEKVLFCGTPCHVAGLRAYLGKEYENMLLVDLICHGVGSKAVFDENICDLEREFGCKIASYGFREKKHIYEKDHIIKITSTDGDEIYLDEDRYLQLFVRQDCLRSSCGKNCKYRSEIRQGDFTIGDFKRLGNVFPQLAGSKMNFSTIVVNSEKANKLLDKLKENMDMLPCAIDDIKKNNPVFYSRSKISEKRDEFFEDFIASPTEALLNGTRPAKIYKRSLKRKVINILPEKVRAKLMRAR